MIFETLYRRLTFIRPPQPLHPIPLQRHPGQLHEALGDVEVDERRHLEEAHGVLLRVALRLRLVDLPLEGQVEPVADQDLGDAGRVLVDLLEPAVDALEAPLVGDVVHEEDALGAAGVRPDDGAEAALAGGVPQLQLHAFAVDQDDGLFESCN